MESKEVSEKTEATTETTTEATTELSSMINRDKIRFDARISPFINYALMQNGRPIITGLKIVNDSEEDIENVDIEVSSEPEIIKKYIRHLEVIPAGKTLQLNSFNLIINADFLLSLSEKLIGYITVTLKKSDDGTVKDNTENGISDPETISENSVICKEDFEITVLAYDQWHGYGYYPELLTAFVLPNNSAIPPLMKRISEFLDEWTKDSSIDAYQTKDRDRVLNMANAAYTALLEQQITYAVPPASFGDRGQRVRLCDTVIGTKMGTCLDLTLLYVSVLEAIGLNPIMIIMPEHIFAGVWLEENTFPDAVTDDASQLTKRLAAGISELIVVECTSYTEGRRLAFDEACKGAEEKLLGEKSIDMIIDVARARLSGVTPLPQRNLVDGVWHLEETVGKVNAAASERNTASFTDDQLKNDDKVTRKALWERKLLDLGMRNTLINMHMSQRYVPILTSSIDDLEDALSDGKDFSVFARPDEWHIPAKNLDFENMHDMGDNAELIQSEFKKNRLRSSLPEGTLQTNMKELYRAAKLSIEENGANTLYIALGLLRWYETERSTKARYAPILLVPVEIVRKGGNQGYVIRLRDDESQMNITMLEKLRQDFSIDITGLDPLPNDEHGTDTRKVFTIIRKGIMNQKRWDVLESAYIGIFSFAQFVMWNDIRNRSRALSQNKVVKSLIDGKLAWEQEEMDLDTFTPDEDILLPMPVDASQLYAVDSAAKGQSFVLHGPPGTGKSQTITVLIANAIAQGKTVLFVAEKMAALEVVQKRLEKIGLGPFCLELHSNKAKKRDILEQLRVASEVTKTTSGEEYARKAAEINGLRHRLDAYAVSLGKVRECGCNLYELINRYEQYSSAPDIDASGLFKAEEIDGTVLDNQKSLVMSLAATGREIGSPAGHPLSMIKRTVYNQELKDLLVEKTDIFKEKLRAAFEAEKEFCNQVGFAEETVLASVKKYSLCAALLLDTFRFPASWSGKNDLEKYYQEISATAESVNEVNKIKAEILSKWNENFLMVEPSPLISEYSLVSSKWAIPKALGLSKLCKKLTIYAKGAVDKESIGNELLKLQTYRAKNEKCSQLVAYNKDSLEELYRGEQTDWNGITELIRDAAANAASLKRIYGSDGFRNAAGGNRNLSGICEKVKSVWQAYVAAAEDFTEITGNDLSEFQNSTLSDIYKVCDAALAHRDELKEWITWKNAESKAVNYGLGGLATAYENGMANDDILPAFYKATYKHLAKAVISSESTLNEFSGALFDEQIRQFKLLEDEITELAKKEIYCRLAAKVPNFAREASKSSEIGILQKAIKSGGRGLSIRQLLDQLPELLLRLCPCLLMSPISVAQYISPDRELFDLVVFDEASQMPTCKAVGALARGKDAVIVGDPNQMPPTSFFATTNTDEENPEEDLESILDDCQSLKMPETHLLWHYRSHHESLIAFSNSQFYDNKLYTFPSVNDRESKVSLVHIDGTFERGKNRLNKKEARAVVDDIIERFNDPRRRNQSIGVVTFNIQQQNLIDDMLAGECEKNAQLDAWVNASAEPVFIKNLENVQGDERDVILFSIGYGPDEKGNVYMNFGPLNRDKGWRRLNVAVSRSRDEMKVFSALTPDMINLSRTESEGVAALRAFIEYAAGHTLVLKENEVSLEDKKKDEGIADAVCRFLKENGYNTDKNVGHSKFRVDIGVIDPDDTDNYIVGILLDSENYQSSKITRDRELAQISVLNSLGWEVTRLWSMDWWDNREKEEKKLLEKITKLRDKKKSETGQDKVLPGSNTVSPKPITPESMKEQVTSSDKIDKVTASAESAVFPMGMSGNEVRSEGANEGWNEGSNEGGSGSASAKKENRYLTPVAKKYEAAVLELTPLTSEQFISPDYERIINNKIDAVIQCEAPITESLLFKKIVQSCDISRAGSNIQKYLRSKLTGNYYRKTKRGEETVIWNHSQNPATYDGFRGTGEGDNKREAKDVPYEEAANALCYILGQDINSTALDLFKNTANLLGYSRMGNEIQDMMVNSLAIAKEDGKIELRSEDNTLTLTEKGKQIAGEYDNYVEMI